MQHGSCLQLGMLIRALLIEIWRKLRIMELANTKCIFQLRVIKFCSDKNPAKMTNKTEQEDIIQLQIAVCNHRARLPGSAAIWKHRKMDRSSSIEMQTLITTVLWIW